LLIDSLNKEINYTLSLAIGIHQFFELGGSFDFEEDFLSVLGLDFQVELLGSWCWVSHV
jgi:hypothetical protein